MRHLAGAERFYVTKVLEDRWPDDLEPGPPLEGGQVKAWRLFMAMVEHEVHDRSQLDSYLASAGVEPPQLYGYRMTATVRRRSSGARGDHNPLMPLLRRDRAVGLLCAAVVIAVWSSFIPVSRLGLSGALGPADLVALRFGVAGVVMLPVLLREGTGGLGPWRALLLALTAGIGFSTLAYLGLSLAPASHAAVLMPGILPLWTALISRLWLGAPLGRLRAIGLALIAAGVAAMAGATLGGGPPGQWVGDLCFLGASLSWAVFTVAARAWKVPPVRATAIVSVISGALVPAVYLLVLEPGLTAAPVGEVLFHAVYQGLVVTIVALIAFTRAVATLGAAPTAMITAAVPVVATLLAIPLLGERPSLVEIVGLALVTAGMLTAVVEAAAPRTRRA